MKANNTNKRAELFLYSKGEEKIKVGVEETRPIRICLRKKPDEKPNDDYCHERTVAQGQGSRTAQKA